MVDPTQTPVPNPAPETPPARPEATDGAREDSASRHLTDALGTTFTGLKFVMALAILVFLVNGFFTVEEGTVALKARFGAYVTQAGTPYVYEPGGIYYAVPLIDRVDRVEKRAYDLIIDQEFTRKTNAIEKAQGTDAGEGSGPLRPGQDGYAITGDTNILHSIWKLEYTVGNPYRYLVSFQPRDTGEVNPQTGEPVFQSGPERLLREVFRNAVVRVAAGIPIDEALRYQRFEERVRRLAEGELAKHDAGIVLTSVKLTSAEPPRDTLAAFKAVIDAQSDRASRIDDAKGERNRLLAEAFGEAERIRNEALIYRSKIVSAAQSDADNIKALLAEFKGNRQALQVYLEQYHQEVVQDILQNSRLGLIRKGQTWYMTAGQVQSSDDDNQAGH